MLITAACGSRQLNHASAPGNPGTRNLSIEANGLQRSFLVHLPTNYSADTPWPLVVMLHGGGGNGKAAARETGWPEKADNAGFIAVFPNAGARNPKRRASFALNPQLWNDGSNRFYADQKPVDDVAFIDTLLDHLQSHFAIDPARIYVTVFFNGASMSFLLDTKLSNRIAAIAPVAGVCWINPGKLSRPVPMLYITGNQDSLNLVEDGAPKLASGGSDAARAKPKPPVEESILKWVQTVAAPLPAKVSEEDRIYREHYGRSGDKNEVMYIKADGLGHTWADGHSILPESMVSSTSNAINATDIIWDFFQRHPLNQKPTKAFP